MPSVLQNLSCHHRSNEEHVHGLISEVPSKEESKGTIDCHLTPRRWGLISQTYMWGGGFQRYRKSFKIGHKPFYSQVNDKEW